MCTSGGQIDSGVKGLQWLVLCFMKCGWIAGVLTDWVQWRRDGHVYKFALCVGVFMSWEASGGSSRLTLVGFSF